MKKLKSYNNYINESLKDKLKGKSVDEIKNNILKINVFDRIEKIKKLKLSNDFLPTDEEIRTEIDKHDKKHFLYLSKKYGYLPGIKELLDNGLSKYEIKKIQDDLLTYNQLHILKYLIKNNYLPINYNFLKTAITESDIDSVKFIFDHNPNYEIFDRLMRKSILKTHILNTIEEKNNNFEIIKILIHNGGNSHVQGDYLIKHSSVNNYYDMVKYLLDNVDYDIDIIDTCLSNIKKNMDSYDRKNINIHQTIDLLEEYKKENDINESLKDKLKGKSDEEVFNEIKKLSPYDMMVKSVYYNYLDGVKLALKKGADINIIRNNPLGQASFSDHIDIVKYLIKNGSNININNGYALYISSSNNYYNIVELLLKNGAHVNNKFYNPLMIASKNGNYEIVKLLLESGADPSVKIFEPLTLARENGHVEIQKLLIKYIDRKIHGKKINESLKDKIKGKSDEEIINDYLKNRGYDINDKFSIAIMTSEFNSIDKELLKTVEVEDLKNTKDTIYTKNILGTVPELVRVFKSAGIILNIKNVFSLIGI